MTLRARLAETYPSVGFGGNGHPGDGDLLRKDGVHAAGKAQLNGTPHLTAVQSAFDKGGHDRAEGADVVEVTAHEVTDFAVQGRVVLFGGFQVLADPQIGQGFRVAALEGNLVFDVDPVTLGVFLSVICLS